MTNTKKTDASRRPGRAGALLIGVPLAASAVGVATATPAFAGTTKDRTDQFSFQRFSVPQQVTCSVAMHIEDPPYHNEAHVAFASVSVSGPAACAGQLSLEADYTQPDQGFGRTVLTVSGTTTKLHISDDYAPVLKDFQIFATLTVQDCVPSGSNTCSFTTQALTNA